MHNPWANNTCKWKKNWKKKKKEKKGQAINLSIEGSKSYQTNQKKKSEDPISLETQKFQIRFH